MALAALNVTSLSQHAAYCPAPLHIQKSRRATFRTRILGKSSRRLPIAQYINGPLDDIIDEIRNNIWESPLDYSAVASSLALAAPLEVPLSWAVTPLPVSRLPSSQPLTVRKNRESRSSASDSSMGDPTHFTCGNSQDDEFDGGPVGIPASQSSTAWPLLDLQTSHDSANASSTSDATGVSSHEAYENAHQLVGERIYPTKRRPSVLRLFTGLSRLRRSDTGETSGSSGEISDPVSPALFEARESISEDTLQEPSEDAVDAYIRKNARNGIRLGSIMTRIARRLPSPAEHRHDEQEHQGLSTGGEIPTTLRPAVRVFSEVAQFSKSECQEFWIAIEVEGALHNRVPLSDGTIDVIFVVDNAYYVSRDCLSKALDAVNSALYHLDRGDRVALYTTHCTHQSVTGNRPDLLFPLRPFDADTEDVFRDLTTSIARCGTQAWKPPRPNPAMADLILGIARSLEKGNIESQHTHVVLFSPAAHVLHDLSKSCPELYVHQINPASVPYRRLPGLSDVECAADCCKNVFVSNWAHYQAIPGRLKRILKYARSAEPVGQISQVNIDLRVKDGCEIIEILGSKDIATLRLGQVHTVFAKLRTRRSVTKAVDLFSENPVFNSSLDVKDLRQQLHNSVAVGAVKAHLLDVQVLHQNTLHASDCWSYTQTPLLVVRDLGGLAPPFNASLEVHKRRLFQAAVQLGPTPAQTDGESLFPNFDHSRDTLKKSVQRVAREINHYQQVFQYEQEHRQRLPLCPGPIALEASPHEWLMDMRNRKRTKRQDVAMVEEEISGLIDGLHGLERLG